MSNFWPRKRKTCSHNLPLITLFYLAKFVHILSYSENRECHNLTHKGFSFVWDKIYILALLELFATNIAWKSLECSFMSFLIAYFCANLMLEVYYNFIRTTSCCIYFNLFYLFFNPWHLAPHRWFLTTDVLLMQFQTLAQCKTLRTERPLGRKFPFLVVFFDSNYSWNAAWGFC